MQYREGRRLCIACTEAACPGAFGLTWAFGSCAGCQHFGITTAEDSVLQLAEIIRDNNVQPELF